MKAYCGPFLVEKGNDMTKEQVMILPEPVQNAEWIPRNLQWQTLTPDEINVMSKLVECDKIAVFPEWNGQENSMGICSYAYDEIIDRLPDQVKIGFQSRIESGTDASDAKLVCVADSIDIHFVLVSGGEAEIGAKIAYNADGSLQSNIDWYENFTRDFRTLSGEEYLRNLPDNQNYSVASYFPDSLAQTVSLFQLSDFDMLNGEFLLEYGKPVQYASGKYKDVRKSLPMGVTFGFDQRVNSQDSFVHFVSDGVSLFYILYTGDEADLIAEMPVWERIQNEPQLCWWEIPSTSNSISQMEIADSYPSNPRLFLRNYRDDLQRQLVQIVDMMGSRIPFKKTWSEKIPIRFSSMVEQIEEFVTLHILEEAGLGESEISVIRTLYATHVLDEESCCTVITVTDYSAQNHSNNWKNFPRISFVFDEEDNCIIAIGSNLEGYQNVENRVQRMNMETVEA